MIIYWHGTGSSSIEATVALGQQTIHAGRGAGGIVAAPGPFAQPFFGAEKREPIGLVGH
jgi:hypothetical protein